MRAPFFWSLILLAACAPLPPQPAPQGAAVLACPAAIVAPACPACPQCAPPKPAPETARYLEAPFAALPGWESAALAPSLRAFVAGCPRAGALARTCEAARLVPAGNEPAARQ